jgi:hypothetical protein
MNIPEHRPLPRPRDFALLLLASPDLLPRKRARDQRADVTGLDLKRRVLELLADLDPEPAEMEATLANCIDQFGPPYGPTRAIAILINEEWQAASVTPEWALQLLEEATQCSQREPKGPTQG